MIEDQSTNGTTVDGNTLTSHPKDRYKQPVTRLVLNSGNNIKIFLHNPESDLLFRVRIPHREDEYEAAYAQKVEEYFARHGLQPRTDPLAHTGPPDIFKYPADELPDTEPVGERMPHALLGTGRQQVARSPSKKRETQMRREWNGSGKYNRIGSIGKGAFAIVYKVTSKYDGNPYAAKELEKRRFIKNGILDQKVDNEMKIMQRVQHVWPLLTHPFVEVG